MSWKDFDATARKLKKTCDVYTRKKGGASSGDLLDEPIEYFDLRRLIEGYEELRSMHRAMRKFMPGLLEFAKTEEWNRDKG